MLCSGYQVDLCVALQPNNPYVGVFMGSSSENWLGIQSLANPPQGSPGYQPWCRLNAFFTSLATAPVLINLKSSSSHFAYVTVPDQPSLH